MLQGLQSVSDFEVYLFSVYEYSLITFIAFMSLYSLLHFSLVHLKQFCVAILVTYTYSDNKLQFCPELFTLQNQLEL